jgi:hypothetical protein
MLNEQSEGSREEADTGSSIIKDECRASDACSGIHVLSLTSSIVFWQLEDDEGQEIVRAGGGIFSRTTLCWTCTARTACQCGFNSIAAIQGVMKLCK